MADGFIQMENLLGKQKTDRLSRSRIAVFGLEAPGASACDALARCGVGSLTLVDHRALKEDQINRHPAACLPDLGKSIPAVMKERIRQIDEGILVHTYETEITPDTVRLFDFSSFDYVIDTLEDVSRKLLVIRKAAEKGVPVISCMETAGRVDARKLVTAELSRSGASRMARELRTELKHDGPFRVMTVYSREKEKAGPEGPGSIVFVPAAAGLLLAQQAVLDLMTDIPGAASGKQPGQPKADLRRRAVDLPVNLFREKIKKEKDTADV